MFWCCGREPKVRVVVSQREATSRAKWVAVSRFVSHSIVSGLRVNPETRSCLEDRNEREGRRSWIPNKETQQLLKKIFFKISIFPLSQVVVRQESYMFFFSSGVVVAERWKWPSSQHSFPPFCLCSKLDFTCLVLLWRRICCLATGKQIYFWCITSYFRLQLQPIR